MFKAAFKVDSDSYLAFAYFAFSFFKNVQEPVDSTKSRAVELINIKRR